MNEKTLENGASSVSIKDNLETIYASLLEVCPPELLEKLKKSHELSDFHFGIGLYIRNNYLYGNEMLADAFKKHYKVFHLDDVSNNILKDFKEFFMSIAE